MGDVGDRAGNIVLKKKRLRNLLGDFNSWRTVIAAEGFCVTQSVEWGPVDKSYREMECSAI